MDWNDETQVIMSAGPVRVDVSDPDPHHWPRSVGFLADLAPQPDPEPTPQDDEEKPEPEDPWRTWDGDQA